MPIKLSIDETLDEARREIRDFSDRQVPFALKQALNRTAEAGKSRARAEMARVFDRPKPFTLNSLYILKASKSSLQSAVGIKDASSKGTPAARYLAAQIAGGDRQSKPFERALRSVGGVRVKAQAVPGKGVPLDKHGNVTRGRVTTILKRLRAEEGTRTRNTDSYFVGRPRPDLPEGVWKRERSRLVPALVFVRKVEYRPRFAFLDIIRKTVEEAFNDHFKKELHEAHLTRKR
ncbi:hypothetical protein [Roseospira goensis]|uniref:Uncharacterized protein n=1 Tax=Roseospira goensis TaxID=391922 RepID=A0A7W6S3V4_9PROT|nr:hypothetical protein [Roseospira goensis]MBB4287860.1 hypothetical protein [Roseospira goensis]